MKLTDIDICHGSSNSWGKEVEVSTILSVSPQRPWSGHNLISTSNDVLNPDTESLQVPATACNPTVSSTPECGPGTEDRIESEDDNE